jgi:hypothetical protein
VITIYGLVVTQYVIESPSGERHQDATGHIAELMIERTAGPGTLIPSQHPFTEEFKESIERAAQFVEAKGWWRDHGALTWDVRGYPQKLPVLHEHSMGLTFALGLGRFLAGLAPASTAHEPPIDCCELRGVAASAKLGACHPHAPALVPVECMPAKWQALRQYAEVLGITTFVVAAGQTDLPGESRWSDGVLVGGEHLDDRINEATGNRWPILIIRAVDVADAITRLARAQARNLIAV